MDTNDIEILEFIQEIIGTTRALNYLSKDESEDWMKKYYRKMGDWFVKVDLWLNSKTDDEKMKLFRTDTIQTFLIITDLYLRTDKARFSGMDIEKGYFNIEDSYYLELETLYNLIQRHYKTAHDNLMSESHSEVTPQKPQPEIGETAQEPQPNKPILGRKKKQFKDLIIPNNKDEIYKMCMEKMRGASPDVAIEILKNWINNKIIVRPSYNTFIEAFPNVKIPESTYYNKLKG